MIKQFTLFCFLGLFLLLTACGTSKQMKEENARQLSSTPSQTTKPVADANYKIRSGDEIEILVWEQPSFNTTTTVSGLGTMAIPLVGELEVSGLTHDQLKSLIKNKLSEYIRGDINLTVSIRNTDTMMVSVFGMVTRADNYPVVDETSIFKILSMAGGPSEEANIRRVKIYRKSGSPHYELLDLTHYLDSGQMNEAATVYPGDVVYVPRKDNVIRQMSEFLRDVVLLFGIFRVFN
jgi:protein involved in polysaccharide export with SLBB domain